MSFALTAGAPFSLQAAAAFAVSFPGTQAADDDGGLRVAWAVDGDWRTVGVALRQDGEQIHGEFAGSPPSDLEAAARRDIERILCLDVDAREFLEVGRRDPVVGTLQKNAPGLRPVLFFTPYEAAAWSIIGQRIAMSQAAVVKQRLADGLGQAGAFPAPERLAELTGPQRGLTERKIEQLRGLGLAAAEGRLNRDRLRKMTVDDALADLQQLAGIGPFSAELVLIRGVGAPDALPTVERRLEAATRALYGLDESADITSLAEGWRPFRSWVAFLVRASR